MFSIHFLKKKPLDEYNETLEEFKIKFAIFSDLKEHEKIGREKVTKKQFYKKKDDDVSLEKDKEEEEKNKNKEIIKKIKLRKYNKDRKKNGLPVKDENSLDKEKNVDKNDEKSLDKDNEKKIIEEITKESDDESDKDKSDKDESDKDKSDKDKSDKDESDKDESDKEDSDDEDSDDEDSDDEDSDDEDDKEKCYYIYNIYYNGYFQKISRWWNSENRGKTLMYLKEDFTNFIKFLNDIKNKYNFYALNIYYKKLLKNIHKFINLIMPGLYNLKKTYKNEIKIKAQIDSIILTMIDFKNETQIKKNTKTLFSQLLANPIGFCSQ